MNATDSTADPADLVRRWFYELFNRGELAVADEILAEDVGYDGPQSISPSDVTGPADIKAYVETYQTAFPDLYYTVEDTTVTDGTVVVRWSAMGTHENDLFGIEPTGEGFAVDGINVFSVADGRITAVSAQWDAEDGPGTRHRLGDGVHNRLTHDRSSRPNLDPSGIE